MTDNRIPKRCKSISISQWLRSDAPSSVSKSEHHKARNLDPSSVILSKDDQNKRIEDEAIFDTTSLERDPGKRQSIGNGNFDAILDHLKRVNEDYRKVLDSGPKNATYRSPRIQKQIANILGNKVRAKIREEVGDSKFCFFVDEALDVANKEQMAIILRFVDSKGLIREQFFKVINVVDTCSLNMISK
ncbi:hypothetical protein QQ045_011521 [Rhodiola kirilowii]